MAMLLPVMNQPDLKYTFMQEWLKEQRTRGPPNSLKAIQQRSHWMQQYDGWIHRQCSSSRYHRRSSEVSCQCPDRSTLPYSPENEEKEAAEC